MRQFFFAIAMGVILTGSVSTFSTPSTQIWIPSTDIQAYLKPHLGWDVYANTFGDGMISNGGVTVGVLPLKLLGLEVGIDYRDGSGVHGNPILFNAKIAIPENTFSKFMPAIAVGGFDFGIKKNVSNYNLAYGIASKNIWKIGRLSAGVYKGFGPDELWMSSEEEVQDKGVMVSWDRVISELSDKLWLGVDFQSGQNSYGALSFGAGWNFVPNVGIILGYNIYNDSDLIDPTFTMQVDINVF
jgi:hypothetical protein